MSSSNSRFYTVWFRKTCIVVLQSGFCSRQLDRSYLQGDERDEIKENYYFFLFFCLFVVGFFCPLSSGPSFKPIMLCECIIWFWQCIRATGNLMFALQGVRLLVWPHFGASTSETGHMSHQPLSNVPSRTFRYLMTTILSKGEVQQSLEHTTLLPRVALFQG